MIKNEYRHILNLNKNLVLLLFTTKYALTRYPNTKQPMIRLRSRLCLVLNTLRKKVLSDYLQFLALNYCFVLIYLKVGMCRNCVKINFSNYYLRSDCSAHGQGKTGQAKGALFPSAFYTVVLFREKNIENFVGLPMLPM